MPYKIATVGTYVEMRFVGAVSSQDIRDCLAELEQIESRSTPVPDRITDLSESEMVNISFDVLDELARRRTTTVLKNKVRSAIFAPRPVQYGLARMFQTLNDNPNIVVHVFWDGGHARNWLLGRSLDAKESAEPDAPHPG
jgi:hypothetical protein